MPRWSQPVVTADRLPERSTDAVLDLVRRRAGLIFPAARRRDVEAAISTAMTRLRVTDPAQLLQRLIGDDAAFAALAADLTVGETYFLREAAQIEVLRRRVLPDLVGRGGATPIRLWSAGCATGEEAYSLAILLEQEGIGNAATIIGTDISAAALARAQLAEYGAWSLRGVPSDVIASSFQRRGDRYLLAERLRRRVMFATLNLAAPDYRAILPVLDQLDLILCRNVLIYFAPEAVEAIAARLHDRLAPGGWLVTGPSDPPLWSSAPFETVVTAGGVLYRRRDTRDWASPPAVPECAAETRRTASPAAITVADPLPAGPVPPDDPRPGIRALADGGEPQAALAALGPAIDRYPLDVELHYLAAVLQIGQGHLDEAAASLRRVLYLDAGLAVAHLTLGTVLRRLGAVDDARRAFRNALTLAAALPADTPVALAEGEPAARLAAAAEAQLAALETLR